MRGNSQIANEHFHKKWQPHVKMWFDQPMQKQARKKRRERKVKAVAPRPVEPLRPVVRCPTVRYNTKTRIGRGFSLQELKACKISPKLARTIGIAVDYRRRNKSIESLQMNVQRLKEYRRNLVLFPLGKKKKLDGDNLQPLLSAVKVNKNKRQPVKLRAHVPTEEERNFKVYEHLRQERAKLRTVGNKLKRKRAAEDNTPFGLDIIKTTKGKKNRGIEED